MPDITAQPKRALGTGFRAARTGAGNLGQGGKFVGGKAVTVFEAWKAFVIKGNVLDLAVGIIIGAAFTAVVNSIVNDLISPIIGLLIQFDLEENFAILRVPEGVERTYWATREEAKADGVVTLNWGAFCQAVINFLIIGWCVFIMVTILRKLIMRKENEEAATKEPCPFCLEDVKIGALRCPHCTQILPDEEEEDKDNEDEDGGEEDAMLEHTPDATLVQGQSNPTRRLKEKHPTDQTDKTLTQSDLTHIKAQR